MLYNRIACYGISYHNDTLYNHMCIHIYIYIYICIERERYMHIERERKEDPHLLRAKAAAEQPDSMT